MTDLYCLSCGDRMDLDKDGEPFCPDCDEVDRFECDLCGSTFVPDDPSLAWHNVKEGDGPWDEITLCEVCREKMTPAVPDDESCGYLFLCRKCGTPLRYAADGGLPKENGPWCPACKGSEAPHA